jgi:hypothetical protein
METLLSSLAGISTFGQPWRYNALSQGGRPRISPGRVKSITFLRTAANHSEASERQWGARRLRCVV